MRSGREPVPARRALLGADLGALVLATTAVATAAPAGTSAAARGVAPSPVPSLSFEETWKATIGLYRTGAESAVDVNLRGSFGDVNAWAGVYAETAAGGARDGVFRLGAEYAFRSETLRVTPTLGWGSNGFWGGQLYVEAGRRAFLIAGVSRTNLKDSYSLSFDPNESLQLGGGLDAGPRDHLSAFCIFDVRLGTGQQDTHVVWRHALGVERRLTLDAVYKCGHTASGTFVRGLGAQATVDVRRVFLRVAYDPYANFGDLTMWRLGGGVRF